MYGRCRLPLALLEDTYLPDECSSDDERRLRGDEVEAIESGGERLLRPGEGGREGVGGQEVVDGDEARHEADLHAHHAARPRQAQQHICQAQAQLKVLVNRLLSLEVRVILNIGVACKEALHTVYWVGLQLTG